LLRGKARRFFLLVFCGRHSPRKKGEREREISVIGNINHNFIHFLSSLFGTYLHPFFLNNVPDVIVYVVCGQIYILHLYVRRKEKGGKKEKKRRRMHNGKDMILD